MQRYEHAVGEEISNIILDTVSYAKLYYASKTMTLSNRIIYMGGIAAISNFVWSANIISGSSHCLASESYTSRRQQRPSVYKAYRPIPDDISKLKLRADEKLIHFVRHAQGHHNVAGSYYLFH